MLSKSLSKGNRYKDVALFNAGILIKLFLFHYLMGTGESVLVITIKNLFTVIAIYCMVSFIGKNTKHNVFLAINFIISVILFMDAMYYSHFFTLIPIHSIYQVGQLGPVSNSIISLIRPQYFLFFIDFFVLWLYYKKYYKKTKVITQQRQPMFLVAFCILILLISSIAYGTSKMSDGNYTPHNLGVINYHLYDIARSFTRTTLDIKLAEGIIENMNHVVTDKNAFGLAEGKNVIVIQAESVQSFVIDKKIEGQAITPVLNSLIDNESIYFSKYYEQVGWGNTSDAEFISHNGFYPSSNVFSYKRYEDNEFTTLPLLLKEKEYSTIAFHGNYGDFWNREAIYPAQGIDTFISLEDFEQDEMIGIGLSDGSLFRQSMDYIREKPKSFYGFYTTVTSHHPFTLPDKYKHLKIPEEYEGTVLDGYLQTVNYLDREIGKFIEELKQEGLYENTIIVIYGDHQGLDMRDEETNELLSSFLNKPYEEDEMFRIPLIIHIPNKGVTEEIVTVGGQIDFFPTMANLLGIDMESNITLGKDLLNIEEGFVAKRVHVARGSFIDNEKIFIMSNDGIYENSRAWDHRTGETVDLEEAREGYARAIAETNLSEYILENNLIPLVRKKGMEYIIEHRQ
ncbi:MAG: LTA synthase family protein [Clostridiaceae bacterium]|nr:LTA synthase family protein [Clostridiaceae bacterium]